LKVFFVALKLENKRNRIIWRCSYYKDVLTNQRRTWWKRLISPGEVIAIAIEAMQRVKRPTLQAGSFRQMHILNLHRTKIGWYRADSYARFCASGGDLKMSIPLLEFYLPVENRLFYDDKIISTLSKRAEKEIKANYQSQMNLD
jgi:hypothetical protein